MTLEYNSDHEAINEAINESKPVKTKTLKDKIRYYNNKCRKRIVITQKL